jgi:alpha-D-glucose phosphate-specific phosphoglucomutase
LAHPEIQFGTDGWRAVISDTFTFRNVGIATQAIAGYLKKAQFPRRLPKRVVVGYDTRFLSREFAQTAAGVFAGNGFEVLFVDHPAPTPAISHVIRRRRLRGGLIITASHNPPIYNGVKFKAFYAGSSSPEMTKSVEELLGRHSVRALDFAEGVQKKKIRLIDETANYVRLIRDYLDMKVIRKARPMKILVDSMYGSGKQLVAEVLKGTPHQVTTLHHETNPSFEGTPPEPIDKNLGQLMNQMKRGRFDVGLATDGDADRIGAVDPKGRFVNSQWIFSLLALHLVRHRGWRGAIAKSLSSTTLLDKIAEKYRLKIFETPVGFKHIVQLMRDHDILIGGEESGGLGFKKTIPERDGILSGLLLVEMVAAQQSDLISIRRRVEKEFGRFYYNRYDWHFKDPRVRSNLKRLVRKPPRKVLGQAPAQVVTYDGLKLIFSDLSWLLMRPSGTEPVLRIYAEASSPKRVEQLLKVGVRLASHGA